MATNIFPGARYFQNGNHGYPFTGAPRRVTPKVLAVIHIADSMSSAESQTRWSFTAGKSWTFMLDRDGSAVQSLDPVTQTPWTNGRVTDPDTSNSIIASWDYNRFNFNEACFLTIENVGMPFSDPVTAAQKDTIRRILAWGSDLSGIPASRTTVIGHYQIDALNRRNCPVVPAEREALFNLLAELPDTALPEDDVPPPIIRILPATRALIAAGTKLRDTPAFGATPRTFGSDRNSPVAYVVEGEAYRTSATETSKEWLEVAPASVEAGERRRYYVPALNVTLVKQEADCSAVEAELTSTIDAYDKLKTFATDRFAADILQAQSRLEKAKNL